jgi:hypothetical protein
MNPAEQTARYTDPPAAAYRDRDEWAIDQSLQETFPASDPISPARPGSIVGLRNAEALRRHDAPLRGRAAAAIKSALPWMIAAGGVILWRAIARARRGS